MALDLGLTTRQLLSALDDVPLDDVPLDDVPLASRTHAQQHHRHPGARAQHILRSSHRPSNPHLARRIASSPRRTGHSTPQPGF